MAPASTLEVKVVIADLDELKEILLATKDLHDAIYYGDVEFVQQLPNPIAVAYARLTRALSSHDEKVREVKGGSYFAVRSAASPDPVRILRTVDDQAATG